MSKSLQQIQGKPVVLTGLRANNDLHIGNYFGALLPLIDMAKSRAGEYQINLFVPDLHSFTTPINHAELYEQILNNLKLFVAAGLPLDNPDVHIYRQSFVPAHSELTWILDCFTDVGEMSRMTQFKDKSGRQSASSIAFEAINKLRKELGNKYWEDEKIELRINEEIQELNEQSKNTSSVGLFNYPVLMASDILLYGASYVPVGDDQTQHIEFTRDIAERMNKQFGELFRMPEPVKKQHEFFLGHRSLGEGGGKDQGLRIKDLADPTKKMSKSDDTGKGVIFLSDDPKDAAKKVLAATTDSVGEVKLDPQNQPGIANLLQILALLKGQTLEATAHKYVRQTQYSDLKKDVAAEVENFLTDFQRRFNEVDMHAIETKLEESEAAMNELANQTLLKVQKAVGLRK